MLTATNAKPRRPRSAYNIYFREIRPLVQAFLKKQAGNNGNYSQLSQLVSQQWRKIPNGLRAHYQKLAAQDKRRYGIELVRWQIQQEAQQAVQYDTNQSSWSEEHPKPPREHCEKTLEATEDSPKDPTSPTGNTQRGQQHVSPFHGFSGLRQSISILETGLFCPRPIENIIKEPQRLEHALKEADILFLKKTLLPEAVILASNDMAGREGALVA